LIKKRQKRIATKPKERCAGVQYEVAYAHMIVIDVLGILFEIN
jgi:hypothetical protein